MSLKHFLRYLQKQYSHLAECSSVCDRHDVRRRVAIVTYHSVCASLRSSSLGLIGPAPLDRTLVYSFL